jgi:leader peptidase (prepilin peptidase)/N-methyltransferase
LLSVALFFKHGLSLEYFLFLLFAASLVTISFIDLQHQIIPDVISLPGIPLGLIISVFLKHVSWTDSLIGIIGGGGFLFIIATAFEKLTGKEGMGFGDVKFLAMIGAWMGWKALPFVILISSLTGTLVGGGTLLLAGRGLRAKIPFGPFLAIGTLFYFFFGEEFVIWYDRLLKLGGLI